MRVVLSELEKLEGRIPGVLVKVRTWFEKGIPSAQIPELLRKEFGDTVSVGVVDYYRCRRWVPYREKSVIKKDTAALAMEAVGGDAGFDLLVAAKLWELMDKMTIPQLLTARALFIKIKAQNLKEQEFLFKTGQLKPGRASGPEIDPETRSRNALRKFKEIFGLAGDEPPKPRIQKLPEAVSVASSEIPK